MKRATQRAQLLLIAAAMTCFATAARPVQGPVDSNSEAHTWKMTYQAGAALIPPGAHLKVSVAAGEILLQPGKGDTFRIPAMNVTAVVSNFSSSHRASRVQAEFWATTFVGSDPFVMLSPFGLAVAALTYPIKSHESYIRVAWTENGADQEVVLSLARSDYSPFLTELQAATGRKWTNLEAEWQQLKEALVREAANSVALTVDRPLRVGKGVLKPGPYQLVVLDREPGQGDAYFFKGSPANLDNLAAAAHVEVTAASAGQNQIQMDYGPALNGTVQLAAVRLPTKTLHLSP